MSYKMHPDHKGLHGDGCDGYHGVSQQWIANRVSSAAKKGASTKRLGEFAGKMMASGGEHGGQRAGNSNANKRSAAASHARSVGVKRVAAPGAKKGSFAAKHGRESGASAKAFDKASESGWAKWKAGKGK